MHIDEYVLKPFSARELMIALGKIKLLIDEEIARKENVHMLQEHYRQSLPELREVFLASLITRKLSLTEIEEKALNYSVNLQGQGLVVSVLSMDNPDEQGEECEEQLKAKALQSLKYSKDNELKLFAVLSISEEIVEKHRQLWPNVYWSKSLLAADYQSA